MTELNRRDALIGAAVTGAAAAMPVTLAHATAPLAGKQAPGFYRYKLGSIEVTVVTDGARANPLTPTYISNASKDDINKALQDAYLPTDQVTHHYAPIVINTGKNLILVDTGFGPAMFANTKGVLGQVPNNLAAAGIALTDIDTVVISHFHADHVNGLVAADGKPMFPNAEIKVPAVEWKYWMDDGEMSRAPAGRTADLFKDNRRVFDAIGRKVTPYEWNKDVMPGLLAIPTIGHTPGHTSYVLSSGNDKVFVQMDVTNNPALFATHPGWYGFFDQDPQQAETTRRKVYDMLVADKFLVQAFHYPFPGLGHVEKAGDGYRVIPTIWNPSL